MSQQDIKLEEGTQEIFADCHENQQINIHKIQDQDEKQIFFQQENIDNEIKEIESKQIIQEEQDQKQNGIQKNHINQIQNTINEQPDNLNKQQDSENDVIQTEKQDNEQNFLENNKYLQNGHQECQDENKTDSKIDLNVCNNSNKNSDGVQNEGYDSNNIQLQNQDKNCINKNNNNGKQNIIQEQNEALEQQTIQKQNHQPYLQQIQQNNSIQGEKLLIQKEESQDQEKQKQTEKIDELQQTQENDEQNKLLEMNQQILENQNQQQELNINTELIQKDSQVNQNLDIISVIDQNNIQNKLINNNEQVQQQNSQLNELNKNQIQQQDDLAQDILKNENINTQIIKLEKNIQQSQQVLNKGEDNKNDFQKFTMDLIQQQLDEKQKIIESYKQLVESYQIKEKNGIQQDQEKQEQKDQGQIIIEKVNEQENLKEEQQKDNNNDQNYEDIFQQFMKKQEEDYKKKKQVNLESEELKENQQNDVKKDIKIEDQTYINNDNDENKNKIEELQDKQEEKNTDIIKENTENLDSSQIQNLKVYQNENENQQKVVEVQNQSYNKFKELQNMSNQQQQNLIQSNFNKDNQSQKSGKDHSLSVLSEEENGQGKSLTAQLYKIRGNQLQEEEQQKQPKRIKRSLEGMAFLEIHQLKYREGIKKVLNKKSIQKLIKSVIIKLQKQLECKDKSYDFFKPKNNFNHQTFDNVIKFLKFEFKTNCYPIIVNYQIELSYFLNLHDREDGLYTLFIDFDETKKSSVQMLKQEEINIFFYFWDNQYQQVGGLVNFDKNHRQQMKQNDLKQQQQQELNGLQNSELFNSVMFSQILGKSQQQLFTSVKLEKIKAKKGLVINQEYFQQNCILLQEIQKEKLEDQTMIQDKNQVVQEYLYYDKFLQKMILVKKLNKQVEKKSQIENNNEKNTDKFSTFSFKSNDEFEYLIKILLNQIDINDEKIAEQQLKELENNISCQNLQDLIKQIIFYVKVFSKNNKIEFSQSLKYFQKLEGLVFVQKQGDIINNSVVFGENTYEQIEQILIIQEFFGGCEYKNEQKQVTCYMPEYINKNLDNYFHKYMTPSNKSKFIFQVYEQIVDAISFLNKLDIQVENLNEYNILVQRKFIPQRTYQCQYQVKLSPNFFNKYQQEKQNSKANSVSNSSKKQSNESRKNHLNYFTNKQNQNETQIQNETQNLIQQQIQDINSLQNYNGSINITESQMFKTDDSKQVMTNNNQNKLEKKQLGLFYHPRYFYKNYPVTPEKDIVFSLGVIIMSICKRMKLVQFSGYVELDIKNTIEKLTGFPYENIMQFYEFLSQGKIKEGKKFFFQKKYPSSSSLKSYWNKIPKIQDLMQEIQELKNEEQLKKEKSIQQQEKIEKNHKIEVYRKFQLEEGEFKGRKLEDAISELERKFGVIEEIELNRQKEEAQKLLKLKKQKELEEQKKLQQQQQNQNQQFNRGNQYGNNQYGYQGSYGGGNGYGAGAYGYNNSNYNQNQNQNYNQNGQNQNQNQKNSSNNNNNEQEQSQQVDQVEQNQQEQGQITNNQNNQRVNGIQNASGQNITVQGSSFKG